MTGDITYAPIQAGSGGGAGGVGGAADSNGNHDFTGALEGSHSAIFGGSGGGGSFGSNGGGGGSFGGSGGGFGGSFGNAAMENGNTSAPAVVCIFFSNTMLTVVSGTCGFLCTPRASLDITLLFNFVCSSLFIPRTREVGVPELHCCAQYAWHPGPSYYGTHLVQSSQTVVQGPNLQHFIVYLCFTLFACCRGILHMHPV